MNRISTYSNAETIAEQLNCESDISHEEVVSACIALARQVDRLQEQIKKLESTTPITGK